MSTAVHAPAAPRRRRPGESLVAPLDWAQWRTLAWEAVDEVPPGTPERWSRIAHLVDVRCPASEPQRPEVYRAVFERAAATARASDSGAHVWSSVLYGAVHDLLSPVPAFMNLGYVPAGGEPAPALAPEDEPSRLAIQLYDRAVAGTGLPGCTVLEVGCGTGGGAAYVRRYHGARRVIGVDLLEANVAAARALHPDPALAFVAADSEGLPVADVAVDAVISVESSHSYPSVPRFLAEVRRVLRPGGRFLFADHRPVDAEWGADRTAERLRAQLAACGLHVTAEADITDGVVRAMDALDAPKRALLDAHGMGGADRAHFEEVMHCQGSTNYARLATGAWRYRCFQCRKPAA